jgi:hypothetical protein
MKNVYLLPTDKPSRLRYDKDLWLSCFSCFDELIENKQHIYITSEEELTNGWYICEYVNGTVSCNKLEHSGGINKYKIILTTDPELIADGVQAIDDSFLEWFVKNPNCDEVEIQDWYNELLSCCKSKEECHCNKKRIIFPNLDFSDSLGSIISTISLAQDMFGSKEETIEEAAEKHCQSITHPYCDREKAMFIKGAKWQELRNSFK